VAIAITGCATPEETTAADDGSQMVASAQTPESAAATADTDIQATRAVTKPEPVKLRSGHPDSYTVQPGDTLWAISERFLQDPWLWPEVWYLNPDIENPHLIYPGDVIELFYGADGLPQLTVRRGRRTVKLTPEVRIESIGEAIPPIPLQAIGSFLEQGAVLSPAEWEQQPYIVALQEGLIVEAGNKFYARGAEFEQQPYGLYRPDTDYVDPDSTEYLGKAGLFLGTANREKAGDPATFVMASSAREALPGDRLYLSDAELPSQFAPRAGSLSGRIIDVLDGVNLIGQYHNVVLNRGAREGMAPGDVFGVLQAGEVVGDPHRPKEMVLLPDERSGLLIVYKVFDKVSYALIMKATRTIRVMDRFEPPELSDL
jgi:nucleoid-associated protein YgaU